VVGMVISDPLSSTSKKATSPKNSDPFSFYFQKTTSSLFLLQKKKQVGMVILLVKKIRLLGGNIFYLSKNETPHPFVKNFGMTSGTSVSGTVGLTLVRKNFKCFNFYSID